MTLKRNRFEHWLQTIFHTQDEEISCSECLALVSRYVDVELSGEDAASQMPAVKQHLDQCPTCREEYETLRDLQQLENKGDLPSVDDLKNLIP